MGEEERLLHVCLLSQGVVPVLSLVYDNKLAPYMYICKLSGIGGCTMYIYCISHFLSSFKCVGCKKATF